jgi:hypothetical protein
MTERTKEEHAVEFLLVKGKLALGRPTTDS